MTQLRIQEINEELDKKIKNQFNTNSLDSTDELSRFENEYQFHSHTPSNHPSSFVGSSTSQTPVYGVINNHTSHNNHIQNYNSYNSSIYIDQGSSYGQTKNNANQYNANNNSYTNPPDKVTYNVKKKEFGTNAKNQIFKQINPNLKQESKINNNKSTINKDNNTVKKQMNDYLEQPPNQHEFGYRGSEQSVTTSRMLDRDSVYFRNNSVISSSTITDSHKFKSLGERIIGNESRQSYDLDVDLDHMDYKVSSSPSKNNKHRLKQIIDTSVGNNYNEINQQKNALKKNPTKIKDNTQILEHQLKTNKGRDKEKENSRYIPSNNNYEEFQKNPVVNHDKDKDKYKGAKDKGRINSKYDTNENSDMGSNSQINPSERSNVSSLPMNSILKTQVNLLNKKTSKVSFKDKDVRIHADTLSERVSRGNHDLEQKMNDIKEIQNVYADLEVSNQDMQHKNMQLTKLRQLNKNRHLPDSDTGTQKKSSIVINAPNSDLNHIIHKVESEYQPPNDKSRFSNASKNFTIDVTHAHEHADQDNTYQTEEERVQCPDCSRRFNSEAFEKHSRICKKVFMEKRKKFDSKNQRQLEESDIVIKTELPKGKKKKSNMKIREEVQETGKDIPKWKLKSEQFRNAMKQGKNPEIEIEQIDLRKPCPHCNRKFNDNALEKHQPVCKEKNLRYKMRIK